MWLRQFALSPADAGWNMQARVMHVTPDLPRASLLRDSLPAGHLSVVKQTYGNIASSEKAGIMLVLKHCSFLFNTSNGRSDMTSYRCADQT